MTRQKGLINFALIAMILAIIFVANMVLLDFEGVITAKLCGYGVDYDNPEVEATQSAGRDLAVEIERNGAVLLKNQNNSLPLQNKKVNIFGWGGCDNGLVYMGGGSGEGYRNGRVSLYQGFRDEGIEINESLASAYNSLSYRRNPSYSVDNSVMYRMYEPDASFYSDSLMQNAKNFSSNAIIVISRYGQEGTDWPKCQYDANGNKLDNGKTYASLSEGEELLISKVSSQFENVIVLLNVANVIESGFIDDDKIDSAVFMGMPGVVGTKGIAQVLLGKDNVSPSGKLADTIAYDFTTAPTFVNAGSDGISHYTGKMNGMYPSSYIDYAESVYVGYRWYETAETMNYWSNVDNKYGKGYEGVVQYPFGYGLSYASFSWAVDTDPEFTTITTSLAKEQTVKMRVLVTNTSETYSGADVVELYYEAPYTVGGIEKSSICLLDFGKTAILQPGETGVIDLSFSTQDLASYDCYDANNNEFMGYEVEEGIYKISLRKDVHTPAEMVSNISPSYSMVVPANGYTYENDDKTGNKVENRFTTFTNSKSGASSTISEPEAKVAYSIDGFGEGAQGITYLSRANFGATMPVKSNSRNGNSIYESCARHEPRINPNDTVPTTGSKATSWKLIDLIEKDVTYNDPIWDELISQLSVTELATLSGRGGYVAIENETIGKPYGVVCDGPSGLSANIQGGNVYGVVYPCQTIVACTWDWKQAYKMGRSVGDEANVLGVLQWYGPGLNTHRSPFGGRNFEYFSEDPILAGKLCAKEIQGAKERGLACYVKHFAANDSDTGRNGEYRWLTEQSLREIYLKPFEIAVKDGGCNAMMTSVDRIGSTRAAGSYALLTSVLRNEWGFKGSIVTDYYQGGNVHDADENVRAGNDMQLDPNGKPEYFRDQTSGTGIRALQQSAKNQLWTYVECRTLYKNDAGISLDDIIVSLDAPFAWWKVVMYVADGLIVLGCGVWVFFAVKKTKWSEY